jgi:hypothetical protein
MSRPDFEPEQARIVAKAFETEGVEYVFIGKGAAILLGFPGTTQDVDVFVRRSVENGRRIVAALRKLGFDVQPEPEEALIAGKDFVQFKNDPFDLDVVFAPDGIPSFTVALERSLVVEGMRVANLRDIIASKRASGRAKDLIELEYLERFRQEYEKLHTPPLRSAADLAAQRFPKT